MKSGGSGSPIPPPVGTPLLDGYNIESTSHVLNGCKRSLSNYTKIHGQIVQKVSNDIKFTKNQVIINKIVRVVLQKLGLQTDYENDETLNLKPDMIVKEEHRIVILDIACLYDLYLSKTYESSWKNIAPCNS